MLGVLPVFQHSAGTGLWTRPGGGRNPGEAAVTWMCPLCYHSRLSDLLGTPNPAPQADTYYRRFCAATVCPETASEHVVSRSTWELVRKARKGNPEWLWKKGKVIGGGAVTGQSSSTGVPA